MEPNKESKYPYVAELPHDPVLGHGYRVWVSEKGFADARFPDNPDYGTLTAYVKGEEGWSSEECRYVAVVRSALLKRMLVLAKKLS